MPCRIGCTGVQLNINADTLTPNGDGTITHNSVNGTGVAGDNNTILNICDIYNNECITNIAGATDPPDANTCNGVGDNGLANWIPGSSTYMIPANTQNVPVNLNPPTYDQIWMLTSDCEWCKICGFATGHIELEVQEIVIANANQTIVLNDLVDNAGGMRFNGGFEIIEDGYYHITAQGQWFDFNDQILGGLEAISRTVAIGVNGVRVADQTDLTNFRRNTYQNASIMLNLVAGDFVSMIVFYSTRPGAPNTDILRGNADGGNTFLNISQRNAL